LGVALNYVRERSIPHIIRKPFNEGYNFFLEFTSIEGLYKKLWASKVIGVPISRIVGFLTWESQEKKHLDVGFMACHREYYKGEGGGFPSKYGS
jgi:hypothetical protein